MKTLTTSPLTGILAAVCHGDRHVLPCLPPPATTPPPCHHATFQSSHAWFLSSSPSNFPHFPPTQNTTIQNPFAPTSPLLIVSLPAETTCTHACLPCQLM